MEARLTVVAACLGWLLTITGCTLLNGEPASQTPQTDDPPSAGHSEVVATNTDDVQPAASVEPDLEPVHRWIEQVSRRDDLSSRLAPLPPDELLTSPTRTTSQPTKDQTAVAPSPAQDQNPTADQMEESQLPPPPVLGRVSVSPGVAPTATMLPADTESPAVNAPARAATATTLEDIADQWLANTDNPSFRTQLDQRLLLALAGNCSRARQPLELVSSEQQHMASQFIEALIAIREGHGGQPGAEVNRVLDHIHLLEQSLIPASELRIPTLALTSAVRGYGRYEACDPPDFPSGRQIEFVVYCEVENFLSRLGSDGLYESLFSMRTTVLNRAGDTVLEVDDEHVTDECRTRRRDCFIPRLLRLPATLSPGQYVVKITIADKIAGKVAEKRTTFRIVARP